MPAADGGFDEPGEDFTLSGIDTSNLGPGNHTLYLRLKDNEGAWGIARQIPFEIYEAFTIAGAEYFIDDDPGYGFGIPIDPADGNFDSQDEKIETTLIDTSQLSQGEHTLYIRFRDSLGRWRAVFDKSFTVSGTSEDIDNDGMLDGWEQANGLNPLDPDDASSGCRQ